tara:strand:- start:145 stop:381 length:237 start_codon:yes stop_codon:yes gene_type:complete
MGTSGLQGVAQGFGIYASGSDLFSHPVAKAVSWALGSFTSVFEMGTGGSTPLEPPETGQSYLNIMRFATGLGLLEYQT